MFKFEAKDLTRHYTLEYLIIRGLLFSVPLFICWFLYLELSLMPILAEMTERCFSNAVPQLGTEVVYKSGNDFLVNTQIVWPEVSERVLRVSILLLNVSNSLLAMPIVIALMLAVPDRIIRNVLLSLLVYVPVCLFFSLSGSLISLLVSAGHEYDVYLPDYAKMSYTGLSPWLLKVLPLIHQLMANIWSFALPMLFVFGLNREFLVARVDQ